MFGSTHNTANIVTFRDISSRDRTAIDSMTQDSTASFHPASYTTTVVGIHFHTTPVDTGIKHRAVQTAHNTTGIVVGQHRATVQTPFDAGAGCREAHNTTRIIAFSCDRTLVGEIAQKGFRLNMTDHTTYLRTCTCHVHFIGITVQSEIIGPTDQAAHITATIHISRMFGIHQNQTGGVGIIVINKPFR